MYSFFFREIDIEYKTRRSSLLAETMSLSHEHHIAYLKRNFFLIYMKMRCHLFNFMSQF